MERSLCLLILLINFTFSSEEFIFWADVNVKNSIVYSENLNITKPMVKRGGNFSYLCDINNKKDENLSSLEFLNLHKDKLFECFSKTKINIQEEFIKQGQNLNKNTKLVIYPIHFIIDFKPNSAIIFKSER